MDYKRLVENQREYFNSHQTFDVDFRMAQLLKLRDSLNAYQPKLLQAFLDDLNKSEQEVYMAELFVKKRTKVLKI